MLYITTTSGNTREWHIGEKLHPNWVDRVEFVHSIQADADELEYVRQNITGIPYSTARVQQWHGSIAKFIAHFIVHAHVDYTKGWSEKEKWNGS